MLSAEYYFAATWRVPEPPDEQVLDRVFEAFDLDGAEPCVRLDDRVPQAILVTWDAWVPFELSQGDAHLTALDHARAFVSARMAQAGVAGELARLDAEMLGDDD